MWAALTSRACLLPMCEASSRTIRSLRTQWIMTWRLFMSTALIRVPAQLKCQLPCEDLARFISSFMMYHCLVSSQASWFTTASQNIKQAYRNAVVKPLLKHYAKVGHRLGQWQNSSPCESLIISSQIPSHTWGSQVQDVHLSSKKYNKLIAPQLSNGHWIIMSVFAQALFHRKVTYVLRYNRRRSKSI